MLNEFFLKRKLSNSVAGIGIDILNVKRIESILEKHGNIFCKKIFGNNEYKEFSNRLNKNSSRAIRFLASRFAAKEAFAKAMNFGIIKPLSWKDVQILNSSNGSPVLELNIDLHNWFYSKYNAHISISDEKDLVIAFVVIESKLN